MKTEKINLTDIIIHNLDGSVFTLPEGHLAKSVGDMLYMQSRTIDQEDLARKIHCGKDVEITNDEISHVISMMEAIPPFVPLVNRKVIEYLTSKIK